MSDTESGAVQGAMQGASAGAAFGPWGAAVGALLGGIGGALGGHKKKEARRNAARAAEMRRKQQQLRAALQRRDIIREQRMARANAVAAGASDGEVSSSAVQGAIGATSAQGRSAVNYFDSQVSLDNAYQTYAKKAGKAAGDAAEIFTFLNAAPSLAMAGGDIVGLLNKPKPISTGYTSFNDSAALTNMENNTAFQTFGSSLNLGS